MPTLKTATGMLLSLLCLPAARAQIAVDPTVNVQTTESGVEGMESVPEGCT